jgi:transcriptional regulator with XRE-family HTH domain
MPGVDRATRDLLGHIAVVVRTTRTGLRWPQRRLARESGCSQTTIARIERAAKPELSLHQATKVLRALGIEPLLQLNPPRVDSGPVRDRSHARIVGAVVRRLRRAGFLVATEVEIGGTRWRGFIDVLAMHPGSRLLLVIEVKSVIDDIGRTDRQLGAYVESAWPAARLRGWRPRAATGLLVVLATDENDQRLRSHRELIDIAFPLRARDLMSSVAGIASSIPPRGARAIAMVDPASRRRAWLLPTTLDGRRTPAPYADVPAFVGSGVVRARRLSRERT